MGSSPDLTTRFYQEVPFTLYALYEFARIKGVWVGRLTISKGDGGPQGYPSETGFINENILTFYYHYHYIIV